MADAIISAIIGELVSRAVSLVMGRLRFTSNQVQESNEDKLQSMSHLLIRIHSVVEEAKGRQISNHGALQWLSELIDSEYQGYYLLDSAVGFGAGHQQVIERYDENGEVVLPQVSTLSLFNPAKRVRVAAAGYTMRRHGGTGADVVDEDEIHRVLQRLQAASHGLREFIMLLQNCKPIRRPLATNIFRDGQMFGGHVEKEKIVNFLLHEDDDQPIAELSVLAIVGGRGVGKTTLVQHACDDARVRSHFPVILLNSSSSTYDVKKNELGSSNGILEFFRSNSFCDRQRCLVIFEDVDMHRKQALLEELLLLQVQSQHQQRRCSTKVIFTTRNRHVSNIGTVDPIVLKPLRCAEYWFFFKAHAFAGIDMEDNPRLVSAGKRIARKLNGSFFGAKIVGEVLRDHPDPGFWCELLRSSIAGGEHRYILGDGISFISDLAHNLLPGHVDMCKVTVSNGPFPPRRTTQLAMLKDLCGAVPHGSMLECWADDARFAKVLLCKSVLPFFNHYYIGCCSCTCCCTGSENPCSDLVLLSQV